MIDFSGSYHSDNDSTNSELFLYEDGTYQYQGLSNLKLTETGTWETGGIDGQFYFYNQSHNRIEIASPSGEGNDGEIVFNLYDSNEVNFTK
jgi:hypothetical protein